MAAGKRPTVKKAKKGYVLRLSNKDAQALVELLVSYGLGDEFDRLFTALDAVVPS